MARAGLPGPGDDLAERAAEVVRRRADLSPKVGVILGSGLGAALAPELVDEASLSFEDLPGFDRPAVPGHAGRVTIGRLSGVPVSVFLGRVHLYEGHGMDACAMPVRLAAALGVQTMVITGAVGGIDPALEPGTVVVLRDHVNLMGRTPLTGWRLPDGSPPFVDLAEVYDGALGALALERGAALGVAASPAVYGAMAGPAYETPAELRLLRAAGATVVGMSIVPEAVPARALGLRVLGLCSVTNAFEQRVTHEDVVRAAKEAATAVGLLVCDLAPRMAEEGA